MQLQSEFKIKEGESRADYSKRITALVEKQIKTQRNKMAKGKIPLVMDVDDFGFLLPGYDDLLRVKKSLPDFKITCFTIPLPGEFYNPNNAKKFKWDAYTRWAEIVNKLGWIEIATHGFSHTHNEMDIGYDDACLMLDAIEKLYKRIGLKYVKIFKAPYWQYSYDALMALKDKGWTVAIDRNYQRPIPEGLKTYVYDWSFEEQQLPNGKVIKGHGHFVGQNKNNIGQVLDNILKLIPRTSQFLFISEYIDQYDKQEKTRV